MDASDDDIQATLQRIVTHQFKSGDRDTLTLKYVRTAAEEELELPKDFLKTDGKWKARSKQTVSSEVERLENEEEEAPDLASSPAAPGPAPKPKKQAPQKTKPATRAPPKTSRATGAGARGKGGANKKVAAPTSDDDVLDDVDESPPKPTKAIATGVRGKGSAAKKAAAPASEDDDALDDAEEPPNPKREGKVTAKVEPVSDEEDATPKKPAAKKGAAGVAKGRKRKSPEPKDKPKKRQKVSEEPDDQDMKDEDDEDVTKTAKFPGFGKDPNDNAENEEAKKAPKQNDEGNGSSALSSVIDEAPPSRKRKAGKAKAKSNVSSKTKEAPSTASAATTTPGAAPEQKDDDSSSLSSLIDEGPTRRKSKTTKATAKPKAKPAKDTKQRSRKSDTGGTTSGSAEDTIKLLQSRLLKCGIRKVWARELAKFSSSGEKIAHLKGLLKDVGMDGRFSEEKARQVKAERELARELEDVREGDKVWGFDEGKGRPKRGAQKDGGWKRLTKGAGAKGGGQSGDEESDFGGGSHADEEGDDSAGEAPAKGKGRAGGGAGDGNAQGGRRIARGLKTIAVFDDSESE
ncbi:MAG: hypothetical protein M1831_005006 [Alyxoria varia]|nr:MAG: hypothetical protein M1831_005006 [Alyxoria varia]